MKDKIVSCVAGLGVCFLMAGAAHAEGQTNADYDKGMELVHKGSYKEAIAEFDKALKSDVKHAEALVERSLCKFRLGNYKEVIEDCKALLDDNEPSHAVSKRQAYMMSAGAHNALGQYKEAVECASKAIELAPKAAISYTDRAFAYQQLGEFENALKDLDEAIKLDPKHASNFQTRAAIYEALARSDRQRFRALVTQRKPGERPWEAMLERFKAKTAGQK